MPRLCYYVGPEKIRRSAAGASGGCRVTKTPDIEAWIATTGQTADARGLVAAAFVIDATGTLRIADRRSEHVACAEGEPVFSAGEIFFGRSADVRTIEVVEVSNFSTGYCPEPESGPSVSSVLDRLGVKHPAGFTQSYIFRRCSACGQRNVVKDLWFFCAACTAPLPKEWNFGTSNS